MARACNSNSLCTWGLSVTRPGACAALADPHHVPLDEEPHAERALSAEVVGDGLGDVARALQRQGRHGLGLPALDVVAADLLVADVLAKVCGYLAQLCAPAGGAHGQLRDLVVEVDEALDDDAAVADPPAFPRLGPGLGDVGGAIDLALALA